jgi:hypothetical protein
MRARRPNCHHPCSLPRYYASVLWSCVVDAASLTTSGLFEINEQPNIGDRLRRRVSHSVGGSSSSSSRCDSCDDTSNERGRRKMEIMTWSSGVQADDEIQCKSRRRLRRRHRCSAAASSSARRTAATFTGRRRENSTEITVFQRRQPTPADLAQYGTICLRLISRSLSLSLSRICGY